MKIIEINGRKGIVQSEDHTHEVDLSLINNAQIGEYIFAHKDLAVHRIPEDEAKRIIEYLATDTHAH